MRATDPHFEAAADSVDPDLAAVPGDLGARGAETAVVHFRGIVDSPGRLMVLMTHNTDIADAWEREGEDRDYFQHFSPDGYAMSH